MDREAFAKLLPEKAPEPVTRWAANNQRSELGDEAYTVYRAERVRRQPDMTEAFDNQIRGKTGWETLCNCTACGEDWYTRKGETAGSFFVVIGEDGSTYSAEPEWLTEYPEGDSTYIEVTEGDAIFCPYCGADTRVIRAQTIGDGKTKRLQIAELANIGGYTTILYWLAENQIYQHGCCLSLTPRYAYAIDERGRIKAFSNRQYLGFSLDGAAARWRPIDHAADKWDAIYCDWGSINGRKRGTASFPEAPKDMAGTTGEKTGLAGYWEASEGLLPLQYLKLWRKCPAVENLIHAGFGEFVERLIGDAYRYHADLISEAEKTLNFAKRRPHELLGLSMEDFREIDRKIKPEELRLFRSFREREPKTTVSRLMEVIRNGSGALLIRQMQEYGGTVDKYERYFRKQELRLKELRILADTRSFAQALHPNQKLTEEELWPRRLQEAHDRLSAARVLQLDAGKSRKLQEGFDAVLRQYSGIQWTDGYLEILLPKSNLELVREGQVLRHCVGTYGEKHAEGKRIILFVRRHRRPERCYYTLNISFTGDRPQEVQLHGYGNERHGANKQISHKIPAKVRAFVDRWENEVLIPWFIKQKKEKSA